MSEIRALVVSLAIAGLLVGLMALACAHDTAYYREHGVWWGTPGPGGAR